MKASSHLTRAVFRALIANRPYVSRECLHRPLIAAVNTSRSTFNHQQRRTFLDALIGGEKIPRTFKGEKATPRNLEFAIGKLVDLLRARRSRARTPAHDELADAIRFLFSARFEKREPLSRNEVFLATETYRHLQERELILSDHAHCLTQNDLLLMLETLAFPMPKERYRSDVRAFAELILASFTKAEGIPDESEQAYLTILARTGSAIEARDKVLAQRWPPEESLMLDILKGLILQKKESDFWTLLDKWESEFGGIGPIMHQELVIAFVQADRIFDAQRIYDRPILSDNQPTTECVRQLLEHLVKSDKMNSAAELAQILSARARDEDVVGSLILWHAANDTRLENLRNVVHNLLQSSYAEVSMTTFNNVIEYALSKNKPALAQAIQDLAFTEGFPPDGKTFALQLQHAIDSNDMQLARTMYEKLLTEDLPADDSDLKILNRYVAVLCFEPDPPYELIMRVTDGLLERAADIDVETIAGLCHVFLQRGEIDEAVGLLRHRIDYLPLPDRTRISVVFKNFITDPEINAQRAFNAYELFRVAFPETSCSNRLPLMQAFFDRKRPDLACQTFSHMRQADPEDAARPNTDAYTKCFEGIAQCRDVDGLQTIYNMLKLDLQVELSTKIRNSLMLAHIACQTPWQAIIDHFYKIMDSREGPSYSSFEVALRACETWPPYGSFEGRKIMAIVQSWNLEITKPLYDNYVGVMAGQCEFESAVELIDNMKRDIGEAPDAFTIGTFYNAIPWQFRKDEVEKWAKQAYPELWEDLVSFGEEIDEEWEVRFFKLDRSIDIDDPPLFAAGKWKPELQRQVQAQIEPLPMAT